MISFIENGNDQIISAIECLFVVYHKSIGLWQQVQIMNSNFEIIYLIAN